MKGVMKMNEKQMKILGWVATFMSVMMYVSYFPQIITTWLVKKERDIPLAAANALGIVFGLVTAITALI